MKEAHPGLLDRAGDLCAPLEGQGELTWWDRGVSIMWGG